MTKQSLNVDALHGIKEIMQTRIVSKELDGFLGKEPLILEKPMVDLKEILPSQMKKLDELRMIAKKIR